MSLEFQQKGGFSYSAFPIQGVSDIAQTTGLPKATAHRIIMTLFNTGFLEIVKSADRDGGSHIPIYPVCIDRRRRLIRVGAPLQFDYSRNFVSEKQRMKLELERAITLMKAKLDGE